MSAHRTATPATVERNADPLSASPVGWMVAIALLAAVTLALTLILPASLVLPALSVLFVPVGFSAASGLYLSGYRLDRDQHPGWEFAGLLVFLGFAAGIMTDIPEALATLEQLSASLATTAPR